MYWRRTTTALNAFDFSYDPVGTSTLAVLISDVWARALPTAQQVVWTVVTLCLAPVGGVVYWAVCCRRAR